MDIGDIIRLLFFAFIFLSFFGGLFGRKSGNEEEEQPQRRPRPTDIFESGGEPAAPRPVATERSNQGMQERLRETFFPAPPEIHTRPRSQPQTAATTAEAASGNGARPVAARRSQPTGEIGRTDVRRAERELLERDLTDMPSPMDIDAENRPRRQPIQEVVQARRRRTGGDVLNDSLRNPETLERAFIVKEVLDKPLGLRTER